MCSGAAASSSAAYTTAVTRVAAANDALARLRLQHHSYQARLRVLPNDDDRREAEAIVVDAWRVLQRVPDADVELVEDPALCISMMQHWVFFYDLWGRTVDGPPADAVLNLPPSKAIRDVERDVPDAALLFAADGSALAGSTAATDCATAARGWKTAASSAAEDKDAAVSAAAAAMSTISEQHRTKQNASVVADDLPDQDEDPFAEML